MAEGGGDLEALIRLRKERPTFSRMVSWEFNQSPKPTKRTRRKKKQVTQDNTGEHKTGVDSTDEDKTGVDNDIVEEPVRDDTNSEESSEYDTAPEDDPDMHELTESLESSWRTSELSDSLGSSFRTIDSSTFDSLDIDEELSDDDSDDDEEDCAEDGINSDVGGLQPGRRRHLSKRQKRKRSEKLRVTYANELFNLGHLFDTTDDIDSVFNEIQESPVNMIVQRRIPTLSELCMLATRRKTRSNSTKKKAQIKTNLPPGMKQLFAHWGTSQRMLSEQLSFLQNHILPLICDKESIKYAFVYDSDNSSVNIPLRCVWSAMPIPSGSDSAGDSYRSRRTTAFIFNPSFHYAKEQLNMSDQYTAEQYLGKYRVIVVSSLSAFASAVDLMLPGTVFAPRRRHDSGSEMEMLSQMSKTLLVRVKMALKLRYPGLVEKFFQLVLPYVMWARGHIPMATELFRALCAKESPFSFPMPDGRRAAFLCEIGHMHQMFGDTYTAESFYKLAGETVLEDCKTTDEDIKQVTEQTQILLAASHDTGLLTPEKAVQSSIHWNSAVFLPNSLSQTALSGLVSFLCYHAAHWTESDWITEALSRIQKYEKTNREVLYYKGLLHALNGNERESKQAYLNFKHNTYSTSLAVFEHLGGKTKNPWLPLVNLVSRAKSPVLPMNVVWRTQLQPISITDTEHPMEAHVNSADLNLRISESGHVTGDMQMLLPPMREILLDPYTGQLVLNNIPGHTTNWKSAFFDSERLQTDGLFMPTPVLLHQWDDGSSVHLVKPNNDCMQLHHNRDERPLCPTILYWKGASGQGAKLNLNTEVKNYFRKSSLDFMKDAQYAQTKNWSDEKRKHMAHFVQLAYQKNISMNIFNLSYPVDRFIATKKKTAAKLEKKKDVHKKKVERKREKTFGWPRKTYSLRFLQEPVICGKTVVVHFDIPGERRIALFIPTADKERFMKPKVWETSTATRFVKSDANSQYITVYNTSHKKVTFYNTDGEVIQKFDIVEPLGLEESTHETMLTIGPHAFGITHETTSIWKHMVGLELEEGQLEMNITWSLAPYWSELAEENGPKSIKSVRAVGQELGEDGTIILVHMSVGVAWIDPNSLNLLPIEEAQECRDRYASTLSSDGNVLATRYNKVTVLAQKLIMTDDGVTSCRVALGCDNEVLIVELRQQAGADGAGADGKETRVVLITRLSLPGTVKELHYVGKGDFLVTFTHFNEAESYNEHLLHFKLNGSLCGVLMSLGRGPRSFHSVYLHGNGGEGHAGWYVYMRDGHNGIIGVKLNK